MPRRTERRPMLTARTADRHALYQQAVQEPDADLDFLERVYRTTFGVKPVHIREDFCGTALLASRWVSRRSGNTALGVDLDPDPIAWGRANIDTKLSADARSRLKVVRKNVLDASLARGGGRAGGPRHGFDAVFALNFSYWVFKERAVMLEYFRKVRSAVSRKGLFILDFMGGSEVMVEFVERTRKRGFTYVWDQHRYDPISGDYECHIGFDFKDGSTKPRAYTYHWRLWTIPELRDILKDAGFRTVEVYLERDDKHGVGTGVYVKRSSSPADRCVIAYLVAR